MNLRGILIHYERQWIWTFRVLCLLVAAGGFSQLIRQAHHKYTVLEANYTKSHQGVEAYRLYESQAYRSLFDAAILDQQERRLRQQHWLKDSRVGIEDYTQMIFEDSKLNESTPSVAVREYLIRDFTKEFNTASLEQELTMSDAITLSLLHESKSRAVYQTAIEQFLQAMEFTRKKHAEGRYAEAMDGLSMSRAIIIVYREYLPFDKKYMMQAYAAWLDREMSFSPYPTRMKFSLEEASWFKMK